ncbi:MAG: nitrate/nitrite transporter [Parvibaculum sp.]|nr:nitrate/nitrite transporter [Parvibaculum sp.]
MAVRTRTRSGSAYALVAVSRTQMTSPFLKAGHLPTLATCFLYFDLSFMVWVLLGPMAVLIAQDLGLTAGQKGLLVATPVLAGAVLRIVAGILVGQLKPRLTGLLMQAIVIGGLGIAWFLGVHSFAQALALGVILGVAGASFAVALPMVSFWYPKEHQGTALGLAGAGNSGTVLAALFVPTLAVAFGWVNVLGLAMLPLLLALTFFAIFAKNSPTCPPRKTLGDYAAMLKTPDAWWFMFFYSVTFGGFVGLASFLPIYFHDQFNLSAVHAGYFTAACVFAGSLVRPLGGAIADRVGGTKSLTVIYAVVAILLLLISPGTFSPYITLALFVLSMIALGMGNGAVFQLVPQRFGNDVALMTGLVGMTGGIGGFFLAASLGYVQQYTGSYSGGFIIFAVLSFAAFIGIARVRLRWRSDMSSDLATVRI